MAFDSKRESEQFNLAADYYDQYRPGYPQQMIELLAKKTNLTSQSKVLEIGAGSGKATELLLPYDCYIHCVEPGGELVKRGQEKFKRNPKITYECIRFEEKKNEYERYDLIFAAQSFHWVPQPAGFEKCAVLLKSDGSLALVWNMYLYDESPEHQSLIQLSQKYGGFADFITLDQAKERIRFIAGGIKDSGWFTEPDIDQYIWNKAYTAQEYCGFVKTGNRFLQLPEEEKERAYQEITQLAENNNGIIQRPYLTVLYTAKKEKIK